MGLKRFIILVLFVMLQRRPRRLILLQRWRRRIPSDGAVGDGAGGRSAMDRWGNFSLCGHDLGLVNLIGAELESICQP
jgi:hypothetical protein